MKQGELFLVTLDPTIGSEQSKTRPCVIISTNLVNEYANTVTIAPLTKNRTKEFPFHIPYQKGMIKIEQLRTIDKKRMIKKIGKIDIITLLHIKKALRTYFEIE